MSLFPGFKRKRVRTSGATINLVTKDDGPAVLAEIRRFLARNQKGL